MCLLLTSIIFLISVAPGPQDCQRGSAKGIVLPIWLDIVAASMWPGALVVHFMLVWKHLPWLQHHSCFLAFCFGAVGALVDVGAGIAFAAYARGDTSSIAASMIRA
jgi:hypothetical protein